jgi:hypothetical protein
MHLNHNTVVRIINAEELTGELARVCGIASTDDDTTYYIVEVFTTDLPLGYTHIQISEHCIVDINA